jgi:succinoglycan biosynthesis protein ExoL
LTIIAYLVHDTADAAVARRVRMFRTGGAEVRVGGFNRHGVPADIAGAPVTDLGRTRDAAFARRIASVVRHVAAPAAVRRLVAGADVVVARNLEMLAIAARVVAPGQRLVFECLDIHRLLLSPSLPGRLLRALEARLLARVDLILTSSPSFRDRYFIERQGFAGPIRVEENRLLDDRPAERKNTPHPSPPWRIGWFGMLRCRRSLEMLRTLVRNHPGLVEVTLAGIPSYTEFEDFGRDVADTPGLRFVGRYTATDLSRLYGETDMAWAIDYFEEGLNSAWLLPNRLYESLAHGAVPIALAEVETGRWLMRHDVGITLDDPVRDLPPILAGMTADRMAAMHAPIDALPRAELVADAAACRAFADAVAGSDAGAGA